MVAFWQAELRRLALNQEYLAGLRAELLAAPSGGGSESPGAPSVRLVSRLAISAPDVEQEAKFWCEAVGMQRYETLPGGGAVVAFGPPGIARGDEGGFFAVEVRPTGAAAGTVATAASLARLSFVQIATPSLIRISRVIANGGVLVDGYGYYGIRSPAGVEIRAYVDDRRDPVELIAITADKGADLASAAAQLEALGLRPRGPYAQVSPQTQAYMPDLPKDNVLYGASEPRQAVQVLLLPLMEEAPKTFFQQLPRAATFVINDQSRPEFDFLEQEEAPTTPISKVQGPARLTVLAPPGAGPQGAVAADASGAVAATLDLGKAAGGS